MSPQSLQLEEFFPAQSAAGEQNTIEAADLEAIRLDGYEEGYKSGWNDAVGASGAEAQKVGEELARNLRDLGFTYHEVRSQIVDSIAPLLEEIFSVLFAPVKRELTALIALERLKSIVSDHAKPPVRLICSQTEEGFIRSCIPGDLPTPVTIEPESAVADGQIILEFGETEVAIEVHEWIEQIHCAITSASKSITGNTSHE